MRGSLLISVVAPPPLYMCIKYCMTGIAGTWNKPSQAKMLNFFKIKLLKKLDFNVKF